MFRSFVSLTAATLIYLSTWVLTATGTLFNYLVDYTIIGFGNLYTNTLQAPVEAAWTAFRDIANILIIGVFTFIAISIILGLQEFGQKKLIARVLIIAVLINFSLLFTKMAIDASGFVSYQIYSKAGIGTGQTVDASIGASNTTLTSGDATASSPGIAGRFIYLLGVQTFGNTYTALNGIAEAKDSGWTALLHGLLVMAILLGAALVLFYGSFLLVSRTIMLIFLLTTASVAFASYLIPKWEKSRLGWDAWTSALIWCASLGPILMLALWMTLSVSEKIHGTAKGTFGDIMTNPASAPNASTLAAYLFILGLLFMAFKISSTAASKIGGFNFASMAAALPFTLGSRVAGFALRQTAGWGGYFYEKSRLGQARSARDQAAKLRLMEQESTNAGRMGSARRYGDLARKFEDKAELKLKRAMRGGAVAGSKMNLMNTDTAKSVMKAIGVSGFAAGASSKEAKSYADQIKTRTEAAEKYASKIAPSGKENDDARREARENVRGQRELALQQLEATHNAEKANADAVKAFEQLPQKLAAAQQNLRGEESTATANKVRFDEQLRAGVINQAQHASQMQAENARIKRAQAAVETVQKRIDVLDRPVKESEQAVKAHRKETERLAEDAAKKIVAAIGESGENLAEKAGRKSGNILERALGNVTGANMEVGVRTRDLYKKKIKTASLRDVMADVQADNAPTTPATSAGPANSHP